MENIRDLKAQLESLQHEWDLADEICDEVDKLLIEEQMAGVIAKIDIATEMTTTTCHHCGGAGSKDGFHCFKCGGSGRLRRIVS